MYLSLIFWLALFLPGYALLRRYAPDTLKSGLLGAIAVAHYAAGRYTEAIERSLEAQRLRPGFQGSRRLLCASLAQAGRIDEARLLLATIRGEQPQLSLAWIRENVPYQTPALMEQYLDGFRKAGLREE